MARAPSEHQHAEAAVQAAEAVPLTCNFSIRRRAFG